MTTVQKRMFGIASIVVFILLIPLIAMQFTSEVNWNGFDFIVGFALLFTFGYMLDLAIRKISQKKNRVLIFIVIILSFLLIWAELAVGIFGTPFAGS